MGCDISGIFQRRDIGFWRDVESRYQYGRDYQLFNVLAGVRKSSVREPLKSISELPRGLPSDFLMEGEMHPVLGIYHPGLATAAIMIWMGEHSRSWLTGDEIMAYVKSSPEMPELAYFFEEVARLTTKHESVRFVFGFNS